MTKLNFEEIVVKALDKAFVDCLSNVQFRTRVDCMWQELAPELDSPC